MKTLLILFLSSFTALAGTNFTDNASYSGNASIGGNLSVVGNLLATVNNLTGTYPALNGAAITSLSGANIGSGTVPTARLGSGSATSSTYLRGDQTWATVSGGAGTVTSVGIVSPAYLTVTGSPVTTSGSITLAGNGSTATFNSVTSTNTITAPTVKALDGSGADAAGTDLNLQAGASTGAGAGGNLIGSTSITNTTGSSVNNQHPRFFYPAHPAALVSATATSICTITNVLSGKHIGGRLTVTAFMHDSGSSSSSATGSFLFSGDNEAGTLVTAAGSTVGPANAQSGTTLTMVFTTVVTANGFDLKIAATAGLTPTVLYCEWCITELSGNGNPTILPK